MDTPEMEQQVRVTDDGSVPLAYVGSSMWLAKHLLRLPL